MFRPIEFAPVVGIPIALHRIISGYYSGELSFKQAVAESAKTGATNATITILGMSSSYLAVTKARAGYAIATSPASPIAAVSVPAILGQQKLAETFVETKTAKDPWWVAFVTGWI